MSNHAKNANDGPEDDRRNLYTPYWRVTVWAKVGIDVVYMPWTAENDGFGFIVFARDDLSGWVEGRAIKAANSKNVAKFIYEDVICCHGCPD